jgi:hypothetical protein
MLHKEKKTKVYLRASQRYHIRAYLLLRELFHILRGNYVRDNIMMTMRLVRLAQRMKVRYSEGESQG